MQTHHFCLIITKQEPAEKHNYRRGKQGRLSHPMRNVRQKIRHTGRPISTLARKTEQKNLRQTEGQKQSDGPGKMQVDSSLRTPLHTEKRQSRLTVCQRNLYFQQVSLLLTSAAFICPAIRFLYTFKSFWFDKNKPELYHTFKFYPNLHCFPKRSFS